MPKAVMYIDVDGVLNADHGHIKWSGAIRRFDVTVKRDGGFGYRVKVTFAPDLVEALNALVAEFDLDIVWATTWNEDLLSLRKFAPKVGFGQDARVINWVPGGYDGTGEWKRDGLLADQKYDPMPFIWIDDNEVYPHHDFVKQATAGTPSLLIAPDSNFGITPKHVEAMREFLSAL